ncbi:hypothetical protein CIW49_02540 [Mycolicibacterium sp. P1-18]|uniref:hypothetical protein n=1 Tax=Mycolicibacterium sp. P1-18 TaxID=2024615 RepID=UPI0011F20754|nr:hypothetical protein [Mycolicibacterium sp. P1-18]KAA0102214.1 hypothetical protein CIW49_02540 [Mycolicibacterium sp. P1-18]
MFDSLVDATTGTSGAGALSAWARVENGASARRVAAMAAMLETAYAASGSADRDQWVPGQRRRRRCEREANEPRTQNDDSGR